MTAPMAVRPMGDRALLLDCVPGTVPGLLLAIDELVAAGSLVGVEDVVPAERTLLVLAARPASVAALLPVLSALQGKDDDTGDRRLVTLPVAYDGEDLGEVAAAASMTVAEVVARHSAATYTVAFCGFAPGFAYLTGLDPALQLPRRATPRIRVPAGSVAIAAAYTGIYPRESPGGWHLLGRTAVTLFDVDRDPPALLAPGDTVRFDVTGGAQ